MEVVGHVEGSKLGGLDGKQITDVVQQLTNDGKNSVDKVALVGCGTACANGGPTLVNEVSGLLQQQGATTKVKGYDTPVMVDDQGHKQAVSADTSGALGKGNPTGAQKSPDVVAGAGHTDTVEIASASKPIDAQNVSNSGGGHNEVQVYTPEQIKNVLGEVIGKGTYGKVYVDAQDSNFVLKEFSAADNPEAMRSLALKEAEVFAKFYGPGSAEVVSVGDNLYIRMYNVPGKPLKQVNGLPDNGLALFHDMIGKIEAAGIFHDDLSGNNVMYSKELREFFPIDLGTTTLKDLSPEKLNELLRINQGLFNEMTDLVDRKSGKPFSDFSAEQVSDMFTNLSANPDGIATLTRDRLELVSTFFPSADGSGGVDTEMLRDTLVNGNNIGEFLDALDAFSANLNSSSEELKKIATDWRPSNKPVDLDAPKPKQDFDQRVVVNTDPNDPVVTQAAQNLLNKHPDNTVVIAPTADGTHTVLSGALADGGSKKVEIVGHGDGLTLGGLDSKQIADVVHQLTNDGKSSVDKVALVGCGTGCSKDGPSLVSEVDGMLKQQGATTEVKGYDGRIDVDLQGHKTAVDDGGLMRIAKDAPLKTKVTEAAAAAAAAAAAEADANTPLPPRNEAQVLFGDAFQAVAEKYKAVIGLREPNPLGASLLESGFPSKNFHVKAKSSPTGPTAGFIAESPELSKVPASKHEVQKKYIAESVAKGAELVPLQLTPQRVSELLKTGDLKSLGNGKYQADYPSGTQYFTIKDNGTVLNDKGQPVRVLTNPPEAGSDTHHPLPITADYDLFSIAPKKSQDYNETPFNIGSRFEYGSWEGKHLPLFTSTVKEGQAGDPNMGNISFFTRTIVNSLNKEAALKGYQGGPLVWHGDEANNPFSPGFDPKDRPIFFVPGQKPVQINSMDELLKFNQELREAGYSPGTSGRI